MAVVHMDTEERQPVESDKSLLERLKNGGTEAFDALFEKYRRGLFAYARGMVGDAGLAEDIVQECFLELVRNVGRIDPERGAGGWLYRVARNRALDVLRARRSGMEAATGSSVDGKAASEPADPAPTPVEAALERERAENVKTALNMLPPKERDLLFLRFFGDLKFSEIAQLRRRPLGTVLWQATRSLEKIRLLLSKQDDLGDKTK